MLSEKHTDPDNAERCQQFLADLCHTLVLRSFSMGTPSRFFDSFLVVNRPSIALDKFIDRIEKNGKFQNVASTRFCCLVYLLTYSKKYPADFTDRSVHKLVATAYLVAAKFAGDETPDNKHYAKVFGVSNDEVSNQELAFCAALDFRLHIPIGTIDLPCNMLNAACETPPENHPMLCDQLIRDFIPNIETSSFVLPTQTSSHRNRYHPYATNQSGVFANTRSRRRGQENTVSNPRCSV